MINQAKDFPSWCGKQQRWLGFIQGILFMEGIYSIDDMRLHIKAAKARLETNSDEEGTAQLEGDLDA